MKPPKTKFQLNLGKRDGRKGLSRKSFLRVTVKIKYLRGIRPGSQNIAATQGNGGDNGDGMTQLKSFSSRSF